MAPHSSINVCINIHVHAGYKIKFLFTVNHYCPLSDISVPHYVLITGYATYLTLVLACTRFIFISKRNKV